MGEFEVTRLERALKILSKANLCTILESTKLSVEDCWEQNIHKAQHPVLLKKVAERIDMLTQEHFKSQVR